MYAGKPAIGDRSAVLPLLVEATSSPQLFPRLIAELRLSSMGEDVCRLTITGHYTPPLGSLGDVIDRHVLHTVAEAAIKNC